MFLRPHFLFDTASDAPVAAAGTPPADFSANTVHDNSEFVDTGDVVAPSEAEASLATAPVQTPAAPVQPSQAQPQHRGADIIDVEPQPLPAAMQPQAPVAPAPTAPVAPQNPFAAMADAIKAANPNLSTADIAQRAAAALQGAPVVETTPEVDPDAAELEDLNVRLEALRTQAKEEGTSDYDADIATLERTALKIETRLEVRNELSQQAAMQQFGEQARQWDNRAGQAYPDADIEGSQLNLAIKAKAAEFTARDPDFFHRDASAGFNLVAIVASQMGIAPKPTQQGGVPTPQTPQPIVAPPVMQGQQSPHRPAPQAPQDAMKAWLDSIKAAETAGLGAELELARNYDQAFAGVSFAG